MDVVKDKILIQNCKTILIVEDDESLRENLATYFADSGFFVLDAENGEAGLEVLRRDKPDIIITDLLMPVLNGFDFIAIVTKEWSELPIIVVSGLGNIAEAVEAIRLGAWDYVTKPIIDMGVLEHIIDKSLERASLIKENRQYQEHLKELVEEKTQELVQTNDKLQAAISDLKLENIERRINEMALRESESWYRQLIETMNDGFIVCDENEKLTYLNDKFSKMIGLQQNLLIGQSFFDLVNQNNLTRLREQIGNRKKGRNETIELTLIHESGGDVFTLASPKGLFNSSGIYTGSFAVFTDITRRKQIENALKKSETTFKAIYNNTELGIGVVDEGGNIIDSNPAMQQMLGYSKEELNQMKFADISYPMDNSTNNRLLFENLKKGVIDSYKIEKRYITKDQSIIWVQITASPVRDENGRILFMFSMIENITERKMAEKALQESEKRYRLLFEEMINGFALHEIICDEKGKPVDYTFLDVNPAFEYLTGLNKEDIVGKNVLELMPKLEPYWIERYGQVALTGAPVHFIDFSKDFNKYYEVNAYSPKNGQFATTFSDITERKQAEQTIRARERIAKALLNAPTESVIILNSNGITVDANEVAARSLGLPLDKLLNSNIAGVFSPELVQDRMQKIKDVIKSKKPIYFEDADNDKWLSNALYPVLDDNGEVAKIIVFSRDFTERRKLARELTRLTSEIHNSIKNKVESMKYFISQGQSLLSDSIEKAKPYFSHAEKLASHLSNISKSILFVTRTRECSMEKLIEEMNLRAEMMFMQVDISYSISSADFSDNNILKPDSVQYILEIFTEIINNIVKHSKAAMVEITIKYNSKNIELSVADNGIGFDYDREKNKKASYGIELMEQRTNQLAATELTIDSKPGHGTLVYSKIRV